MSCNAWQEGTIRLPSAAAPGVKKAVRDAALAYRTKIQALCKKWWADNKTSSRKKYREALDYQQFGVWMDRNTRGHDTQLYEDVLDVLQAIVGWPPNESSPRQVQERDLDRILGEKPTNRTTSFPCEAGHITFKGNAVSWRAEDSHACDRPNAHPVAVALWTALDRVTWTRGSGGEIRGNDEYNEDAGRYSSGAGGSYVVREYSAKAAAARNRARSSFAYSGRRGW